jgi:hypothetical protein
MKALKIKVHFQVLSASEKTFTGQADSECLLHGTSQSV